MSGDTVIPRGESDAAYPEVFSTMPPQPTVKKPGQLPTEKIREYFEKGYIVVPDFFSAAELDPCKEAVNGLVDELANNLYKAGKIKDLHADAGYSKRLTLLEEDFPGANVILHKNGKLPPAFRALYGNSRLLDVVEQLVGPEIATNPVWNLRTKTPGNEQTTVPWHQDSAYFDTDSHSMMVLTAWIPLVNADKVNGTLQFVENGHKTGKVARHTGCVGNTWYVSVTEEEMEKTLGVDMKKDVKTLEINYGGMILFNNIVPHQSLPNLSENVRWSMDLRWQAPGDKWGVWGLKKGVVLRTAKDGDVVPDWDSFDSVDRNTAQEGAVGKILDPFDTTVSGPWMKKWDIVHENAHTRAFGAGNS